MKLRPLHYEDLPTMKSWFSKDFIQDSMGDTKEWMEEISNNLDSAWVKYYIIELEMPIGFIQYYETDKAPKGEWSNEPPKTVGIDYFIGEENQLRKGYGTKAVELLIERIFRTGKYDFVIADPEVHNTASIKILKHIGFLPMPNGLYKLILPEY